MAEESSPVIIAADPEDSSRATRRSRVRSRSGSTGTTVAVNVMLVVLIAALAASAWFVLTQQQQLDRHQRTLVEAQSRIGAVEQRLRLTDETLSESDADTSEQLSLWESETRKLWDITNKRNKGWIEDNRAAIFEHATALASAQGDLKTLKSSVSRLDASLTQQQGIANRLTALDVQMQRLIQQQRDMVDKTNAASQIAASLKATLESRVRQNEQAITAIDAHRRQVNANIEALRQDLDALDNRLSSETAAQAGRLGPQSSPPAN